MSIRVGNVVGFVALGVLARAALVRNVHVQPEGEPRLDLVVITDDLLDRDAGQFIAKLVPMVPHCGDGNVPPHGAACGWKYAGPEVLVRPHVPATRLEVEP